MKRPPSSQAASPAETFRLSSTALPAWGLLALAAAVQLLTLGAGKITWTSDQGIVALMGRHLAFATGNPLFCYGSAYGGTLEPAFLGGVFRLLGANVAAFHAALMLLLALWMALVYALGRRTLGERPSRIALLYLAVPPFFLLYKGLSSDGVYDTYAILGTGILYGAVRLEQAMRRDEDARRWVVLIGLLAGLGWWVIPLTAAFYLAVFAWFLIVLPSVFRRFAWYPLFFAAFGVGSLPWWVANVGKGWPSFHSPSLQRVGPLPDLDSFVRFWTEAVPVLLGGRPYTKAADIFPGASWLALLLFAVPVLLAIGFLVRRGIHAADGSEPKAGQPAGRYLLLFLLAIVGLQVVTALNPDSYLPEPRYLLPFYAPFSLILGWTLARASRARGRLPAIVAAGGLLAFHGLSIARAPKQDDFFNLPTTGRVAPLVRALDERKLTDVYTGYWTAYRLAFESEERIRAAAFGLGGDRNDRFPPYAEAVARSKEPAVILRGDDVQTFADYLQRRGAAHERLQVGPHVIFWGLPADVVEELHRLREPPT